MDIITLMPIEIAQKVFKLLSVRDLYSCLAVCKSWRKLVNSDFVWGHFYKLYGIDEIEHGDSFESKPLDLLCSRAVELKEYLLSPAFNWRYERSNDFYVNLKYRQWKVASFKPYFAVLYLSVNELHVFRITNQSVECLDVISVNLPQCVEQPLLMNSSYIIIGAYNITQVYRLMDGQFKLYKSYALMTDPVLLSTQENFDNFVKKHLSHLPCNGVFERTLIDKILWVTDRNGVKHVIDLNTGVEQAHDNLPIYTKSFPNSKYILHLNDVNFSVTDVMENFSVTDLKGTFVCSFVTSHLDRVFYINTTILVLCFPRFVENNKYFIECREISSGQLLRKFSVYERTRVTLDSKNPILYLLSTQPTIYTVTAFCITTGNDLWKYEFKCGPHMFWGSFLTTIGDRFLAVYPAPSSDDFFALFNLKGELLYESPFTTGIVLYYCDFFILAKEEGRLHISSYL